MLVRFFLVILIFAAPLNVYRLPIISGVTLSISKSSLLFVLVFFLISLMHDRRSKFLKLRELTVYNWALYAFVSYLIFMTAYSLQPAYGLKIIFLISTVYLMFVLIYAYRVLIGIDVIVRIVLLSSVFVSGFALIQIISFVIFGDIPGAPFLSLFPLPHEDSDLKRIFMWYIPGLVPRIVSFMTEPNSLGAFLALSCFTSLIVYIDKHREIFCRKTRVVAILNLWVSIIPLISTFSRSGWLTLIFGLIFLMPLISRTQALKLLVVAAAATVPLFLLNLSVISDVIIALSQRIQFSEMSGHINVRLKALEYWYDNMWFGIGLGSYGVLSGGPKGVSSTHSYYVTYLVEGGFLGFSLFSMFVLSFIFSGLFTSKFKYKKNVLWVLSLGLFLQIAFNNIFYHNYWMEFTWVFYAIALISLDTYKHKRI